MSACESRRVRDCFFMRVSCLMFYVQCFKKNLYKLRELCSLICGTVFNGISNRMRKKDNMNKEKKNHRLTEIGAAIPKSIKPLLPTFRMHYSSARIMGDIIP